jgi:hypothetical protein
MPSCQDERRAKKRSTESKAAADNKGADNNQAVPGVDVASVPKGNTPFVFVLAQTILDY